MLLKILRIVFLSSLLFLGNCTSLKKLDKPFCVDETTSQGFCVYLISGKKIHVNDIELFTDENGIKKTWYDMQLGIIKIPLETFKAMKKYLIEQCKQSKKCDADIDSWDRNIQQLELKNP